MNKSLNKISKLELANVDAIQALADEARKKEQEATRESRNREAEARQWQMLIHYLEDPSGPCSSEAKILLKRVLRHLKGYEEDPDTSKMTLEERAFWYMLSTLFDCIETEWLIDSEIDYQLNSLLGQDGAQSFRRTHGRDDHIRFLDERLGPSWRAVQYDYPDCEKLNVEPEKIARFLRDREVVQEISEGSWTGDK